MSDFKKIVERTLKKSDRQNDIRLGAYAESKFEDRGAILRPGDVINMPYDEGKTSLMEAVGSAYVTASGRV